MDWLYPELREFSQREQQQLLMKAKEGSFDLVELIGLAVALALTVVLSRYSVEGLTFTGRFAAVLFNCIVAIPLLLLFGGPFYFRRTRRHVHELIRQRKSRLGL